MASSGVSNFGWKLIGVKSVKVNKQTSAIDFMKGPGKRVNVFVVCPGFGHVNRGYESFAGQLFEVLTDPEIGLVPDYRFFLFGGGNSFKSGEGKKVLLVIKRSHWLLKKFSPSTAYKVEQITFFISLIPYLFRWRPALIISSDFRLVTYLWHLRKLTGLGFRLLFSNGAPILPPFTRMDFVHQLLPYYYHESLKRGAESERQVVIPYGIKMQSMDAEKARLRHQLNLPVGKKIIVSVGAINASHKRMDYVIREYSRLDSNKYFLLLLGNFDQETSAIQRLASEVLKIADFRIENVSADRVQAFLLAADYFLLASCMEGLPRVLPEALSCGLLPIVHDYEVTREVLGSYGIFRDLSQNGQLEQAIREADNRGGRSEDLYDYAFKKFSWVSIAHRYAEMVRFSCQVAYNN